VAAVDGATLRLAVYNSSRTFANLQERGKAALIIADQGLICYIKGTVAAVEPPCESRRTTPSVHLRWRRSCSDEAPRDLEPGTSVTSGITYSPRSGAALARARAVLEELLEGPAAV